MNILSKTFNEMSFVFSSNSFSSKAQKNGLSKQEINNGVIALFLHQNAIQLSTKRMWQKKDISTDMPKIDKIKDAIELLKSHNYKILKPVNDWVEL
jgi:hypothetical protein